MYDAGMTKTVELFLDEDVSQRLNKLAKGRNYFQVAGIYTVFIVHSNLRLFMLFTNLHQETTHCHKDW